MEVDSQYARRWRAFFIRLENLHGLDPANCQVWVYSGKGSGQVRMETDEGREQRAGQEVSPAGVGDRVDSTTKDNER